MMVRKLPHRVWVRFERRSAPMVTSGRTSVAVWSLMAVLALGAGCGGGGGGGSANEGGPFAGGFEGLADVNNNVTVCGECHPSQQANWAQTAHAHAYQTLANIGQ